MAFERYPTGGQSLRGAFQYLQDFGFMDFILPFLLIFALLWGILQRVMLFRKNKLKADGTPETKTVGTGADAKTVPVYESDRKLNAVVAMVIALGVTIPHAAGVYPPDLDPINLINKFLPQAAILVAAILVISLLFGISGAEVPNAMYRVIGMIAAAILCFVILMAVFPNTFPAFGWLRDPAVQAGIIVLLVMGLVGWFVMRESGGEPVHKTVKSWMEEIK